MKQSDSGPAVDDGKGPLTTPSSIKAADDSLLRKMALFGIGILHCGKRWGSAIDMRKENKQGGIKRWN
jgi:hypothetical protein